MKTLKSIDEAGQSPASSPAESDGFSSVNTSTPDPGRRRLVRGAAALAPLVLTLRSGGVLAASSCVGASQLVKTDANGEFTSNGVSAIGNECWAEYVQGSCPSTQIVTGTRTFVTVTPGSTPGALRCQYVNSRDVAILSVAAVTSITS